MTDENLQPLERIPRPEVYAVPWFELDSEATVDTSTGGGDSMDL